MYCLEQIIQILTSTEVVIYYLLRILFPWHYQYIQLHVIPALSHHALFYRYAGVSRLQYYACAQP